MPHKIIGAFGCFARGFFFRFSGACCFSPPPWLVVVSSVVLCRASCCVVLRYVVCFVLCPVLCGVFVSGWVLSPCCSARCCVGSCVCCVLLSCAAAFSAGFFPVVPCLSVVLRALSVSVLCLCGAVLVCLRRCPLRGAFLPLLRLLVSCCLFCLRVCCRAWLSSVVSWWVLVAPGVVFRWSAVLCP